MTTGKKKLAYGDDVDDAYAILEMRATPSVDNYKMYAEDDPSLRYVLNVAAGDRFKRIQKLKEMYSLQGQQVNNILKYFIGYDPEYGAYVCVVSPYISSGYI
jgi:hypothetical protein